MVLSIIGSEHRSEVLKSLSSRQITVTDSGITCFISVSHQKLCFLTIAPFLNGLLEMTELWN